MSQIKIKKGKILKGDKVEISYSKQESNLSKPVICNEEHSDTPHPELVLAMAALKIHSAIGGGFISSKVVKDSVTYESEDLNTFTVSGFTIVGDDEGVIITAQRHSIYGTTGFNTPNIRFDSENYPFVEQLETCVQACKDCFTNYLNGKFAPDPQGTLFEENK